MSAKSPFSPVVRCKNIIMNIAIFASGSGTNCENLIHHFADSALVKVALVVSNKPDAFVLERAQRLGVPTAITPKTDLHNPDIMLPLLRKYDIGFIVLAGWLPLIPDFLIDAFPHKIINIHPALLPKYGGKGMWGHHVHEAVKAAGDAEKEHMLEMEHFPKVVEDIIKKSAADN